MTYEYKLGHLFKRLTMIDMAYGDADHHLARLAEGEQPVRLRGDGQSGNHTALGGVISCCG